MSALTPPNTNKVLYDIKSTLQKGFHTLCCKLDNSDAKDYELFMACDSITGAPVIVTYGYDSTGALTISYTNIDGTPAANTVTKCPEKDYELTNFQWFCDGATLTEVSRTDLYVNGVFDSYIWQDKAGNVIATPLIGALTVGQCAIPAPPTKERDLEKCCYTIDGGLTTKSGWKRFTETYEPNTQTYLTTTFEILDTNNVVIPTAIEVRCPEYTYLPVCDNTIYIFSGVDFGSIITGAAGYKIIDFDWLPATGLNPLDQIVSDTFIDYECNEILLYSPYNPLLTPSILTYTFSDNITNPLQPINLPAGNYTFKRLLKTVLGFEYLFTQIYFWDGIANLALLSVELSSNSNTGVLTEYCINSKPVYSVLDQDGIFIKYVDVTGATYTPTGIIGQCCELLKPKYNDLCSTKEFPKALPFQIVCIDNGVTKTQAQLVKFIDELDQLIDKFYTIAPSPVEIVVNPTDIITAGTCENEVCNPQICSAYANDLSTLCASHNFSITKPDCCEVEISTSIGNFILNKNISFYNTSDFGCLVTLNSVTILSGSCTLDKIYIIANKLK